MKLVSKLMIAASAAIAIAAPAQAVTVSVASDTSTPTLLANLVAGTTYTYSVAGASNLCNGCNSGGALTFDGRGVPVATPTGGYAPLAPAGLPYDPTGSSTAYGIGGASNNLGALLLTGGPIPGYTTAGLSGTIVATTSYSLYGVVNDTNYNDNGPGTFAFTINAVQVGAVPEPATWAMMICGFGVAGGSLRRRRKPRIALA